MSHPIEDKTVECRSHDSLTYCVGSMQGYRMTMEDAHSVKIDEHERVGVFGVFDGHGGRECADVVSDRLPLMIFKRVTALMQERTREDEAVGAPDGVHKGGKHESGEQQANSADALLRSEVELGTDTQGEQAPQSDGQHQRVFNSQQPPAATQTLQPKNVLPTSSISSRNQQCLAKAITVIRDCFFQVDHELEAYHDATNCGTTAIVATVIAGRYVVVANTGDLRCIMSVNGSAKTLSFDHKPSTMGERVRIENSGGYVMCGRVNEVLALSRAFGDFKFKVPYADGDTNKYYARNRKFWKGGMVKIPPELFLVSVEPDILVYDLAKLASPEFMVLACDGIWDCFTDRQLLAIIRAKLKERWNLNHITEHILNECISMASSATGIGFDNMTLVIVALHPLETIDEWYRRMGDQH